MGDAAAVERSHEIRDPEGLVVLADLVGDLLRVAADRRLLERLVLGERHQVLAHAPVELVLRGRDTGGIGDEVGLGAEEPARRLPEVVPRLLRGVGDVDDLVHGDIAMNKIIHVSPLGLAPGRDRKSTRLNSSHGYISYAVFCLKKKKNTKQTPPASVHMR